MNILVSSYIRDYLSVVCNITFTFGYQGESASKIEYLVN
ncbi:hypothetical protein SDC9_205285 [bioreactor metagenome]|uniref:Uncharacterized protein n=1 Tax=bioreactor metagenome TaxID=1076179 RepID=A0A645J1X4_9ZZZZ